MTSGGGPIDYKNIDYRGFIFLVHETYGLALLHCTRKKKKGPHFQLPGGHIDDFEFEAAAKTCGGDRKKQLLEAAKAGAARELWEETGIDVRASLGRLQPAALRGSDTATELSCELKKRLFFFLAANDADFLSSNSTSERLVGPICAEGRHLKVKFSVEHSGFTFEKDPKKSIAMLKLHSGGVCSQALSMAMARDAHKSSSKARPAVAAATGSYDGPTIAGKTERGINHLEEAEDPPVILGAKRKKKGRLFPCFC